MVTQGAKMETPSPQMATARSEEPAGGGVAHASSETASDAQCLPKRGGADGPDPDLGARPWAPGQASPLLATSHEP